MDPPHVIIRRAWRPYAHLPSDDRDDLCWRIQQNQRGVPGMMRTYQLSLRLHGDCGYLATRRGKCFFEC